MNSVYTLGILNHCGKFLTITPSSLFQLMTLLGSWCVPVPVECFWNLQQMTVFTHLRGMDNRRFCSRARLDS